MKCLLYHSLSSVKDVQKKKNRIPDILRPIEIYVLSMNIYGSIVSLASQVIF